MTSHTAKLVPLKLFCTLAYDVSYCKELENHFSTNTYHAKTIATHKEQKTLQMELVKLFTLL